VSVESNKIVIGIQLVRRMQYINREIPFYNIHIDNTDNLMYSWVVDNPK